MRDLISREAAIKAICTQGTSAERDGQYVISLATAKQRAVDILESLPTIDPVKHGRWVMQGTAYGCSLCGEGAIHPFHNYCPNCGARMRGEEDETD